VISAVFENWQDQPQCGCGRAERSRWRDLHVRTPARRTSCAAVVENSPSMRWKMSVARNVICWRRLTGPFPSDTRKLVWLSHARLDQAVGPRVFLSYIQQRSEHQQNCDCKRSNFCLGVCPHILCETNFSKSRPVIWTSNPLSVYQHAKYQIFHYCTVA